MRKFMTVVLLALCLFGSARATTKYFVTAGNWSTDGNWGLASGVAGGTTKAVNGDAAILDGNSGACTVDVASAATTLTMTGYASAFTFLADLTIAGNVTLSDNVSVTYPGTAGLIVNTTATLTSNQATSTVPFSHYLQLTGAVTYTFADAWDINDTLIVGGTTSTTTLNGAAGAVAITCWSLRHRGSTSTVAAGANTPTITLDKPAGAGYGLVTGSTGATNAFKVNLTINTGDTLVFENGGTWKYNTGTLLFTAASGGVITTNSTLTATASVTFNTHGLTWNNVIFTGTITVTLSSNMEIAGLFSPGLTTTTTTLTGNQIDAAGGVTQNSSTGNVTGTTIINMTGGTFSQPSITTGAMLSPLKTTGNVTLANASLRIGTGGWTHTSGTITPGSSRLRAIDNYTFTVNGTGFILNSLRFDLNGTFAGTEGVTLDRLICRTDDAIITLQPGETYTVTGLLVSFGGIVNPIVWQTGGAVAYLIVSDDYAVGYTNPTNIDASLGVELKDYGGTITTSTNWTAVTEYPVFETGGVGGGGAHWGRGLWGR